MTKTKFVASLLIVGALATPLMSEARVNLDINIGPPAVRMETPPPPPQPGYVWAPGYWNWVGGRHVWVEGRYMAPHRGFVWIPDHWVQRGPHYRFVPGHWRHA